MDKTDKNDKNKESRYNAILKLVSEETISRQEEITERLKLMGYNVTQSTVSRDIKKLGIIKLDGKNGISGYTIPPVRFSEKSIFKDAIVGADYAGHMVVIKCRTGTAQAVCATLDTMKYPDIVGTLAGDDTIFILMRSENDAKNLVKKFKKEFNFDD